MEEVDKALEDSAGWLKVARSAAADGYNRISVACCSHGLIRANDALCLKFLDRRPRSHDDSLGLFEKLYSRRREFIKPKDGKKGREILIKWIKKEKVKAEYKGKYYSKRNAKKAIRDLERFLKITKKYCLI